MAGKTTEIERKYQIPSVFELPDLTCLATVASVARTAEHRLDATYYDTVDLRLDAGGTTLRHRSGGDDAGWHLKQRSGADRTETREPLSDALPESLAGVVRSLLDDAEVGPVARIRSQRRETSLRGEDGRVLAVIAADDVRGDRLIPAVASAAWRELEVELVDGERFLLDAVEEQLCSAGASISGSPSKLARTLHGPAVTPAQPRGGRRLASYLRAQRDAIIANDPRVRQQDSAGVHDMRVAARRARSALRVFRSVLDRSETEPLRAELHWLAVRLGAVRDNDVLSGHIDRMLDGVPSEQLIGPVRARIRERLAAQGADARQSLLEALESERYEAVRTALDAAIAMSHPRAKARRLRKSARKALRRAEAQLDRAVAIHERDGAVTDATGLPVDPDVALHEARKKYKRGRYALEVVRPLVGADAKKLGKRLSTLQDVLGDHQDAVVIEDVMREFGMRAQLDGENAYTYGLLRERADEAAARSLDNLPSARRRVAKISI